MLERLISAHSGGGTYASRRPTRQGVDSLPDTALGNKYSIEGHTPNNYNYQHRNINDKHEEAEVNRSDYLTLSRGKNRDEDLLSTSNEQPQY